MRFVEGNFARSEGVIVSGPVSNASVGRAAVSNVMERDLQESQQALAQVSPVDGALAGAVVPGAIGAGSLAIGSLFKSGRSWSSFRQGLGLTSGTVAAGMATGAAGEGIKSLLLARGDNPADAYKNGHLIAGLGMASVLSGAATLAPKGSPLKTIGYLGALIAGATGLTNFTMGNAVSRQEDMLARLSSQEPAPGPPYSIRDFVRLQPDGVSKEVVLELAREHDTEPQDGMLSMGELEAMARELATTGSRLPTIASKE